MTLSVFLHVLSAVLAIGPADSPPTDRSTDCELPITVRLDSVDPEFQVAEADVRDALSRAKRTWEEATSERVFKYTAEGEVAVRLQHSEAQWRQQRRNQLRRMIDESKLKYQSTANRHREQLAAYDIHQAKYDSLIHRLNQNVRTLNQSIQWWNEGQIERTGGTRRWMRDQQLRIDVLQQQIDSTANELRAQRDTVNAITDTLNQIAEETNVLVDAFNQRYGIADAFTKGTYRREGERREIVVYQLDDLDDLTFVLKHELGHALGIDHVDDPSALMYYRSSEENRHRTTLSDADRNALRATCNL